MDISQDAWGYLAGTVDISPMEFETLRALYRAELAYVDERIGELRSALEAAGEWDETLVVVTGDHGENIGDHGLMDHQYCLYETLLRVPLVVGGGAAWSETSREQPVGLVDLAPTLLDVAGVRSGDDDGSNHWRREMQGVSFHPDADASPSEASFAEYISPQPSMEALERRVGSLPSSVRQYDRSLKAIHRGRWKLIRGSDGSVELYDIEDDPGEMTDRSGEEADRVEALSDRLDEWLASFEFAEPTGETEIGTATRNRLEDLGYLQ
jgi:arylsulfatase A-like enzyme